MIVEMDVLAHLIGLLQDRYPEVREELMNAITTLVKFGWLNISFCITQGLMVQQTMFAPRWRKLMSLSILLACFGIRTRTMNASHLPRPS